MRCIESKRNSGSLFKSKGKKKISHSKSLSRNTPAPDTLECKTKFTNSFRIQSSNEAFTKLLFIGWCLISNLFQNKYKKKLHKNTEQSTWPADTKILSVTAASLHNLYGDQFLYNTVTSQINVFLYFHFIPIY